MNKLCINLLVLSSFAVAKFDKCSYECGDLSSISLIHDSKLKLIMQDLPGSIKKTYLCRKNNQEFLLKAQIGKKSYLITKNGNEWLKYALSPLTTSVHTVVINESFYKDGLKQGLSKDILHQTESMFKDLVRFNKNLHKNDKIKILVERKANKNIVTMSSISQKHNKLTAMSFQSHGKFGYYDFSGHALVDSFDRVPIKYKRISSPFRLSRKHPILGYVRPHRGVDLAAPSGTPIYATSSGEIVSLGALRGYGRTIIIKHKGNVETLYAHMHAYAKGLKVGDHVHRKQKIGYVGMTGLATAPHCHYEFKVNNIARDPMKVKLPEGERLKGLRLTRFRSKWRSRYNLLEG